jgi:hypothetical protein
VSWPSGTGEVGNVDSGRSERACHRRRHHSLGSTTEDRHCPAGDLTLHHGVNGVAERVEKGAKSAVESSPFRQIARG